MGLGYNASWIGGTHTTSAILSALARSTLVAAAVTAQVAASARAGAPLESSDPTRIEGLPQQVAQVGGSINTMSLQGTVAFVGNGPRVLTVDVRDPHEMALLGNSTLLPGVVRQIAVEGDRAYVAAGRSGLHVFDVSNPSRLMAVGHVRIPGTAVGVAVSGGYAFVCGDSGGMSVVDARGTGAPRVVSTFKPEQHTRAIRAAVLGHNVVLVTRGGHEYGDYPSIVRIVDVRKPAAPVEVAVLDGFEYLGDPVAAEGNVAFVTDAGQLIAIDLSEPNAPREIGRAATFTETILDISIGAAGRDRYAALRIEACIGHCYGSALARIDDPRNMVLVGHPLLRGHLKGYSGVRLGGPGIGMVGHLILDHTSSGHLAVIDATTPEEVITVGELTLVGSTYHLDGDGTELVALVPGELSVIDVSAADRPRLANRFGLHGRPEELTLDGRLAYVIESGGGCIEARSLHILEWRDAGQPHVLASIYRRQEEPYAMAPAGDRAHVAFVRRAEEGIETAIVTYDVADPTSPEPIGEYVMGDLVLDMTVRDGLLVAAYAAYAQGGRSFVGVRLLRAGISGLEPIGDARSPWDVLGDARLGLNGTYAYVTASYSTGGYGERTGAGQLWVFDVADPEAPRLVAETRLVGPPQALVATGDRLYIGLWDDWSALANNGVAVYDISDPAQPGHLITLRTPSLVDDLVLLGSHLYAATGDGGLYVYRTDADTVWNRIFLPAVED